MDEKNGMSEHMTGSEYDIAVSAGPDWVASRYGRTRKSAEAYSSAASPSEMNPLRHMKRRSSPIILPYFSQSPLPAMMKSASASVFSAASMKRSSLL